jgi:site-specific DNA recombinase
MKTLAAYRRVSHVGGREGDAFRSPDDQAAEIETWAGAHGHRVAEFPPELDGKGSDAARPIFRRVVDAVKAGEVDGVVVAYLSRAGRDLRLMLDLWDEVERAGGAIYSARENVDASTPSGRLHRNLLASIAQHELEERRDGFDRARRSAVERGIWQRRQTPRGYRRAKATRRLVPDRQAESVRAAARDFLAGQTVSTLARQLGMTPSGIRQMLRNRVYLGELRVGEYVNPTAHEAILDPEMFEAIQAKLANGARPARRHDGPALLAGLVRCASCGHVMTRGSVSGRPNYVCPGTHSGGRCPSAAAISCARLNAYAEPIALGELRRLEVTASEGDRVKRAQAALSGAERELGGYLGAISADDVGPQAFAAGARKRRDAVDAAREDLRGELARQPASPVVGTGADTWAQLDAHERNTLLRSLFSTVIVRPAGRGRKVPVAERARVIAHGAGLRLPEGRNGGTANGIVPLAFPDPDDVDVLTVAAGEDHA